MNTLFAGIIFSGNISETLSETLLETAFLRCINLSISASWLILAVLLLRLALRKAPRWICCLLWMLVGLRLLCPFTLQSPLCLIPSAETIPENILLSPAPAISSGIPAVDAQLNPMISASFAPSPEASANPLQIITFIASCIWLIGIFVMLIYLAGSFICLRLKMRTATRLRDNIRQSEFAGSPFILGILRPQIYVHYDLNGDELAHVLAHEQAHIARRDHLLKPLGFLILSVYWFHPLVWLSYLLFCKDIELACDEKVIRGLDDTRRKAYSLTLLSCTETQAGRRTGHRSAINACPLAFGELNVKERILRIKNYRRPAPVLVIAAIAVCAITAFCFLTSPATKEEHTLTDNQVTPDSDAPGNTSIEPTPDAASASTPNAVGDTPDNTPDTPAAPDSQPDTPTDAPDITPNIYLSPDERFTTLTQDESTAITDAIVSHNRGAYTPSYIRSACSFVLLAKLEGSSASGSTRHNISYYGWAYYMEYGINDKGIQASSGSHIPVILTFSLDNDYHRILSMSMPEAFYRESEALKGYVLEDYWIPGDGRKYVEDIQNNFPTFAQADALDSQKYLLLQEMECYRQAVLTAGLDADSIDLILEQLLDTVCSKPVYSEPSAADSAENYIGYHLTEYRTLTYYGEYTLDYSERHPGQNLRGQILLRACEDIHNAILTAASNSGDSSMDSSMVFH